MSAKMLLSLGLTLGFGVLGYIYYRRYKREQIPTKWRRVGTLTTPRLFSVKSCAPLQLQTPRTELRCELLGLRIGYIRDRGMMLVNEHGHAVTCREFPQMQLIETRISGLTRITFQAPELLPIELDFSTVVARIPGEEIVAKIHDVTVSGMLVGAQFDKWFSKAILNKDSGLQLIYYYHEQPVRDILPNLKGKTVMNIDDTGTFSDAASYMLINLSSLSELNKRLEKALYPLQFRSNFDLKTDKFEPFVENQWNWIKIGEKAIFRVLGNCPQSIIPIANLNLSHKTVASNFSTFNIFKRFGMGNHETFFGLLLGLRQPGAIKANDIVYVEDS